MTATSTHGDYWNIDLDDEFKADTPLSVSMTSDLVNNGRHLLDESTQYRVNWVGARDADPPSGGVPHYSSVFCGNSTTEFAHILTHVFPWQAHASQEKPKQPVIRLAASAVSGASSAFLIAAYMMPMAAGIDFGTDEGNYQNGWGYRWTTSVAADGSQDGWVIEDKGTISDTDIARQSYHYTSAKSYPTWENKADGSGTVQAQSTVHVFRLSIYGYPDGYIDGISLREFTE